MTTVSPRPSIREKNYTFSIGLSSNDIQEGQRGMKRSSDSICLCVASGDSEAIEAKFFPVQ